MPDKEEFKQKFISDYDKATSTEYGRAGVTLLERSSLRELYQQIQADEQKRIFGDQDLDKEDKSLLRDITRERVVESIIHDGWPQPSPEMVGATDIAESGVEHACVVAEYLVDTRGPEASPSTFFSYTTKNQFDRYVSKRLVKNGRIKEGGDLYDDWFGLQDREPGYENQNVKYPEGIDNSKIYGVAKPHRYWPAQLMRYLEAIRLGNISEGEREQLKIGNTPTESYTIPWSELDTSIDQAESVDEIAVNIAIGVASRLKENGLNNEQLVEILSAGYSPGGPMNEHGNIPEVHQIWSRVLNKLHDTEDLREIVDPLKEKVEEKIEAQGYNFNQNPDLK